ncbi:PilA pilus assembly protein [Deltaproteobacteria bacterium]|mgnify:CR=1 FL=1|nr:PilA pilus assembly protein [Deltaproteobacteria bacterium]
MIKQLIQDESGATAIEYGLIAGLISVAIIVALTAVGDSLDAIFSQISDSISAAG